MIPRDGPTQQEVSPKRGTMPQNFVEKKYETKEEINKLTSEVVREESLVTITNIWEPKMIKQVAENNITKEFAQNYKDRKTIFQNEEKKERKKKKRISPIYRIILDHQNQRVIQGLITQKGKETSDLEQHNIIKETFLKLKIITHRFLILQSSHLISKRIDW